MKSVERLPADRVNTYHDQSPTTRGRLGSRRERRVDVVDSCDPPQICIHRQHRRIVPPPPPLPVGGQWLRHFPSMQIIRIQIDEIHVWTTSIVR